MDPETKRYVWSLARLTVICATIVAVVWLVTG